MLSLAATRRNNAARQLVFTSLSLVDDPTLIEAVATFAILEANLPN